MKNTRRRFTADFKAKVVLETLKGRHALRELSEKYDIHSTQIHKWKRDFLEKASSIFQLRNAGKDQSDESTRLHEIITRQSAEIDFLKHVLGECVLQRSGKK